MARFEATTPGLYRVSAARASEAGATLAVEDNFARNIAMTALGPVPHRSLRGVLINGEMPFIKDPRAMSATGLVLGVVAYLVIRREDLSDRIGKAETGARGGVPRVGRRCARPGRDGRSRGAA